MKFSKIAFLSILIGINFLTVSANAQIRAGSAYLKILPGTRQQSLANSLTGALDASYSFYANPALSGFLREWQWSVSYTNWIADIRNYSFLYGRQFRLRTPWSEKLTWALGINYQDVGSFDATRGAQPSAQANDLLITSSLGMPISAISDYLSVGANIKYLRTELDQFNASGFVFDLGIVYRTPLLSEFGIFSAGASLNHLGKSLNFRGRSTPLPRTFRTGVAFNLGRHDGLQLQLVADYRKVRDEVDRFSVGIEMTNILSLVLPDGLDNAWGRLLAVRGGYNFIDETNTELVNKWSFGLSIRLDDYMNDNSKSKRRAFPGRNAAFRFDYGAIDSEIFGNVNLTTMTYRPIGPEQFEFVRSPFHSLTPEQEVQASHTPTDTIRLQWEATVDPDLFDNVNYAVLVTKDDRLKLQEVIEKSTNGSLDIFQMTSIPADTKNQDNVRIDVKFLESGQSVSDVSTDFVNKKLNRMHHDLTLTQQLNSSDYYWTVLAYDKNRHFRYIETDGSNIAHFRVEKVLRPDLQITMTQFEDKVTENIVLPNMHFDVDSFSVANAARLNSGIYESLNQFAANMARLLPEYSDISVKISGHADTTGSESYNQLLSEKRAKSFAEYLQNHLRQNYTDDLTKYAFSVANIEAIGDGEKQTLVRLRNEDVGSWWARCRRVELNLVARKRTPQYYAQVIYENIGDVAAENIQLNVADLQTVLVGPPLTTRDPVISATSIDTIQSQYILLDTTISKLEPGVSDTIKVPLTEKLPDLLAWIDKDNLIDESDIRNKREFNNRYPRMSRNLGDFDGDGKTDIFMATGEEWKILYQGDSNWTSINTNPETLEQLAFGDFNADGKTDLFKTESGKWYVFYSDGPGRWEHVNSLDSILEHLEFGDFDGDGATDVFTTKNGAWKVSYGGTAEWHVLAFSNYGLNELAFGDFNGDGSTDVLVVDDSKWKLAYSGSAEWQIINSNMDETLENIAFGDFNADGRTDIFVIDGPAWKVSYGGKSEWEIINSNMNATLEDLAFGDFNGDGTTDVSMATGTEWLISENGRAPWAHFRTITETLDKIYIGGR